MIMNYKAYLLLLGDYIKSTKIVSTLNMIEEMNKYSKNEIIDWQNIQLKKFINHVYSNTMYYKNLFAKNNLIPSDINSIDDLQYIPKLTKLLIKENYPQFLPKNIDSYNYFSTSTGGSTGNTLKYILDYKTWSYISAVRLYYWNKIGYKLGDLHIALGSSSLFPIEKLSFAHSIFYKLKGKIPLNGINMSDEVCQKYIKIIKLRKIKFIYGYASSIYILAKYIEKKQITNLGIIACITTSEILTDSYRRAIESNFSCKILDAYGAADGGVTAYKLNDYFEVGYNSLVRMENATEKSSTLLCTDLFNYSFPFINYEVGDSGKLIDSSDYIFNYNGQILSSIDGRISDIIRLKNGRVITGPGFTILFKDLNVIGYKISKIDENTIRCSIIKDRSYTIIDEKLIYSAFYNQCGTDINLEIEFVTEFERSKSGKLIYFYT